MHKEMPEKEFQRVVLKKLRSIPKSYWVKINDRATAGIPDILGCICGVFIAIELKTKSKVTALQAYTLRRISDVHGQAFVVNPENFSRVYTLLQKLAELE